MPGYNCAVKSCKNSYCSAKNDQNQLRFFSFPKDNEIRERWLEVLSGDNKIINLQHARVCSVHFSEDDWQLKDILLNVPINKRRLKQNAVPSIMVYEKPKKPATIARENRLAQRKRKQLVESSIADYEKRLLLDSELTVIPKNLIKKDSNQLEEEKSPRIKSVAVQTEVEINCAREFKIMELEKMNKLLKQANARLKSKCAVQSQQLENVEKSLGKIFTEGQIKKLKNPEKKINWTPDDISSAIGLRSAGSRAYRYLYDKHFPIPGPSTLRSWDSKMNIKPDILKIDLPDSDD